MRRLMQTIIALPSIACTRFSKCVTRSAEMSAMPLQMKTITAQTLPDAYSRCSILQGSFDQLH